MDASDSEHEIVLGEPATSDDAQEKALAIRAEIFPGPASVEWIFDPSEPEEQWRVIVVSVRGELDQILEKQRQWHRRMFEAFGPEEVLNFTICPKPSHITPAQSSRRD